VTLRRADVRFFLPQAIARAHVLGGLTAWEEGLREAGVELVPDGDLVVAPASLAAEACALRPELLVLEGGGKAPGYATRAVQPLPDRDRPELVLPVGGGAATRYAIRHWRPGLRNRAAAEALARGMRLPGRPRTVLGSRTEGAPFIVAPALAELGLERAEGFAAFGRWADRLSRGAWFLFAPDAAEPGWVVKFARVPGTRRLFDADERGLRLAAEAGEPVASHAPRLVTRYTAGGLDASVETAAVGEPLAGREAIDRIAGWVVAVARATASPSPRRVHESLPPLRTVFQHGDLSDENVFVRDGSFTIVDWESARADGMPLWDVFYFLTHALAAADGVASEEEREQHFVRLWRGELPASQTLRRWALAAAEATDVPHEAIGQLATLLWTTYAENDARHAARVGSAVPATVRFARRWASDPALGPGWSP
jgi:hypothetical protein